MRVAPPVQALSCGAGPWQSTQQMLYALSVAVLAYWAGRQLLQPSLALGFGCLALALSAAWLAGQLLRRPPCALIWDGAAWAVELPRLGRHTGQVALMLDLGGWMLVRFTPDRPPGPIAIWLPLSSRDAAASWPALRVALHSTRAPPGEQDATRSPFPTA